MKFFLYNICVQPTVNYIGVTRTVGVVWVCPRFDYSHFCRRFGIAVLTCRRFDRRPCKYITRLLAVRKFKKTKFCFVLQYAKYLFYANSVTNPYDWHLGYVEMHRKF